MNSRIVLITLFIFFLVQLSAVNGQSSYDYLRAQLLERQQNTRSQIENIDRQIAAISNRLSETTQEYETLYRQYEELTRLISLQQERLRQMNREQQTITEEMALIERNLAELERNLQRLIQEYKSTLTYLYKHGRTTELALILTATSLNQLMIRSFYLSKFNDHVQGQVDQIEETQNQLENSKRDLEQTRDRNQRVLAEIQRETANLRSQEEQQRAVVNELQGDIASLERQVQQQRQQRENLESTMETLIRDEERLRRAESGGEVVVRRELELSDDELNAFESMFRSLRGQLPWPVENGTITQRFGVRVNPVHNTRIPNPGVDISALPGSTVRVVSDGYVFGVQPLQGYGEVVFVSHGNYRTAYGNLSDIYVRKNQVLQQGDVIGLSGDQNSIRGPILFFLIRDGNQMVDPERWLQNPRP